MSDQELPQPNVFDSPASTLPPDVLSLIFQHACEVPNLNKRHGLPEYPQKSLPPRQRRTHFVLSAVCVHWRQVSFGSPYIWTSVDLIVSSRTVNKVSAILQAFLTYSGQLPLAIAIKFSKPWKYDTKFLVDTSFDAVLYQNTHRIRELYLCGLPSAWINLLPSLPNLVHLSIEYYRAHGAHPVTIKSQCSNLTLKSFPGRTQLSCSEITVLRLFKTSIALSLAMLMARPNLIEFRTRGAYVDKNEEIILPRRDSFVFPRMETFEWPMSISSSTDAGVLQHIRLPALRKMIWAEDRPGSVSNIDVFFHNLPSTLVDLRIHNTSVESRPGLSAMASVFDYVCGSFNINIERLTLSAVHHGFLHHIFEILTPVPEINGSRERVKLRTLKAICIKGDFTPSKLHQDKLLRMLEGRFLALGALNQEPFRLEFTPKVNWLPQLKAKLKEMIGHGFKVEIFDGAKPVDWL